jgi:tRNA pseudouridine55 synthase
MRYTARMEYKDEIILVDKPGGVSSYDVIRSLKYEYKAHGYPRIKIGHAGTLDPMATGLMIIGTGKATKKLTDILLQRKTYQAVFILGKRTTTDDIEGDTIETHDVSHVTDTMITTTIHDMLGEQHIAVPIYSAIKKNGKKLYDYARNNITIEPIFKKMHIYALDVHSIQKQGNTIAIACTCTVGSGTYIRSLARELGSRLHISGTLGTLRRISIGDYHVDDARKFSDGEIKSSIPNRH